MDEAELLARITANPRVLVGKPVIKGTRLSVEFILKLLALGHDVAEILAEYPGLTEDDVRACVLFAHHALAARPAATDSAA